MKLSAKFALGDDQPVPDEQPVHGPALARDARACIAAGHGNTHGFDPYRLERINSVIARNYVTAAPFPAP